MSGSREYRLEYLVSEVCKKSDLGSHGDIWYDENGDIWDSICIFISDLILRSKMLSLKIDSRINFDTESILISNSEFSELINNTVNLLLNGKDCDILTIKMQYILSRISSDFDISITQKIEYHCSMFNDFICDIIKIIPYNTSTIRSLYDNLFELLCLNEKYIEDKSDSDDLDRIAEREINAALENVFPRNQIKQYKSLSNRGKIIQIKRLIDIIYGIRLYDRDIGKGGSSITDIPKLIEIDLSEMYGDINNKIEIIELEISNYTKIIELEYLKPGTITVPLLTLQCELRNRYQFIKYLKHYKDEIIQSTEILHTIIKKFNDELKSLHLLFKSEENPLKTQVYPKFAQLSNFWKLIIAEKYCNESRKKIFEILKKFENLFKSSLNEKDIELTILSSQKQENNNNEFIPFHVIKALNSNIIQIEHNIFDLNDIKYNGFCIVSLLDKNGMLFIGNNKQTLIQLNDNKYCFYSLSELKKFASSPEKYINGLNSILILYPELISILGLNEEIKNAPSPITQLQLNSILPHPMTNIPRKISQCVGTPTHFMSENIIPSYSWNEWDLRRKALQIVNMRLKNMKTHSTQTDKSHYKRDNTTQYYLKQPLADGTMPATSTQTGIEKATNVCKKKKFIKGLRGKPNENVSVVTLTFHPPIKRMN